MKKIIGLVMAHPWWTGFSGFVGVVSLIVSIFVDPQNRVDERIYGHREGVRNNPGKVELLDVSSQLINSHTLRVDFRVINQGDRMASIHRVVFKVIRYNS